MKRDEPPRRTGIATTAPLQHGIFSSPVDQDMFASPFLVEVAGRDPQSRSHITPLDSEDAICSAANGVITCVVRSRGPTLLSVKTIKWSSNPPVYGSVRTIKRTRRPALLFRATP